MARVVGGSRGRAGVVSASPRITATTTLTTTVTLENPETTSSPQTIVLRLNRKKKKVSWREDTIDNEFMGKKSSKKCCIFHGDKPFDEDDSDPECEDKNPSACCSSHHHLAESSGL